LGRDRAEGSKPGGLTVSVDKKNGAAGLGGGEFLMEVPTSRYTARGLISVRSALNSGNTCRVIPIKGTEKQGKSKWLRLTARIKSDKTARRDLWGTALAHRSAKQKNKKKKAIIRGSRKGPEGTAVKVPGTDRKNRRD